MEGGLFGNIAIATSLKTKTMNDKKELEGLLIITLDGRWYCATCGMPVINKLMWKKLHLGYHKKNKEIATI